MVKAANKKLKTILIILTVGVVFAGIFLAGVLTHRYSWYNKVPVVKSIFAPMKQYKKRNEFPYFTAPMQGDSEIFKNKEVEYPFTFIVFGDSREPAGPEKDQIIEKIINEAPEFVIHTGDMVSKANAHHWKIFDMFEGLIIDSGIPMYPVLGNHEYEITGKGFRSNDTKERLRHYFKRFNMLKNNRWYSFEYGNSLFIFLDTNVDCSPGSEQYNWLIKKLSKQYKGYLFLVSHYPLHTKSLQYLPRKSEELLADMLENSSENGLCKPDFVFSGHAHNYERYKYSNINYVATGGGGAKQHKVARDKDDFYTGTGDTFHYCRITVSKNKLTFEMVKLDYSSDKWTIADSFVIDTE